MTLGEIKRVISSKIKEREIVEIFRHEIDEYSTLAYVTAFTDKLLCFQNVNDFTVDGYKVVRTKDITDICVCDSNDNLKFINMILKKENLILRSSINFDFKSWESFLNCMKETNTPITLECSFEDAFDYYFGWVTKVDSKFAYMKCYDGYGMIFKDEVKVNLDFVSQVAFGDRYTTLTSKYVK